MVSRAERTHGTAPRERGEKPQPQAMSLPQLQSISSTIPEIKEDRSAGLSKLRRVLLAEVRKRLRSTTNSSEAQILLDIQNKLSTESSPSHIERAYTVSKVEEQIPIDIDDIDFNNVFDYLDGKAAIKLAEGYKVRIDPWDDEIILVTPNSNYNAKNIQAIKYLLDKFDLKEAFIEKIARNLN